MYWDLKSLLLGIDLIKTLIGCEETVTSSYHQDVIGFLYPGGVFLNYIESKIEFYFCLEQQTSV